MEFRRVGKSLEEKDKNQHNENFSALARRKTGEKGLLSQEDFFTDLQTGLLSVLSDLIKKYTGGDSSSVKDETASMILNSIYYALDAFAGTLDNPGDFPSILHQRGVKEIYTEGLKIIRECLEETKALYKDIRENMLKIPLETYNDTIKMAIPEFFRTYDMEFETQNTSCMMDYPLVFDDMTIQGIFYISHYLKALKTETEFCRCFRQKDMVALLYRYGEKYQIEIESAPVSVFEILFDQAVLSVLCSNEAGKFGITELQIELLYHKISVKKPEKVNIEIKKAINQLIYDFGIRDQCVKEYMFQYGKLFTERFQKALKSNSLSSIALMEGETIQSGKIRFEDNENMSDAEFAGLIDRVNYCEDSNKKIEMITANVHSVKDYIDLLGSDCLYGNEFEMIFSSLRSTELAVLGRIIFEEELRSGEIDLLNWNPEPLKRSAEFDWQRHYLDFIFQLDEKEREEIGYRMNHLIF